MTVHITFWTMTSDITPEWAYREADGTDRWRLSWLPDRLLSAEQAQLGMELDELLSDLSAVHDRAVQDRIDVCAEQIGIPRNGALLLLARRMAVRLHQERAAGAAAARGRTPRSLPLRGHLVEPPYVLG
ncbi:hypothetical protein ACWIGW_34075 [Nocardia brasiliensis]